ncbi:MinD-like ATPase involved in chromosome partitioning or flagellar assembly [Nocardiopsis arvandica]|uniref:MinD-like ATPase involved in chromosome partitioning or flagellar assembly n=1 Tax=Nocardiopsis sinuspersici TaxID=501010 RepID=A0A7Z0BJE2_9ACTN|nr:hypothetical protein [Nocardiopsis sinuspersici]NYH51332.1 MinD-like ATPase involved in chromosome partitioning or flagellar assembly [Nocardiopsis sinuspersici]
MIVAVCSLSGAPGVTSLATAITACWPSTPLTVPVLVEADASGGDVASWHGIDSDQGAGLVSLAAASRTQAPIPVSVEAWVQAGVEKETLASALLLRHAVELPGGLRVVAAPADPLEAGRAVGALAHNPDLLASGRVTVIDAGRTVPGSAGAALLRHADVVVVLTDPGDTGHANRLRVCAPVLASLRQEGVRVGLAVAGVCQHSDTEVSQIASGLPVWAHIPHDPTGAALVKGEHRPPTRLRDRLAAWSSQRRDPEGLEWMPLIKAAKALADLCDDFSGVGVTSRVRRAVEVSAA